MKRQEIPFVSLQRLIRGYNLNAVKLADIWHCSYNTAAARLRDPGKITLRELEKISNSAGIPMDEIRACIRG